MIQARGEDTAMAAAMKRYEKEKDDKASASRSTTPSGRGGRGGRNPSRGGNSNAKPRHSNNPNDKNFKGDGEPPECHKCKENANGNLKKHWPYDCWTLHEDRIPERLRKSQAKANKATERKDDDFVDSNSTHISAFAQVNSCDQGNDGDDEHWGWSVIHATLPQSAEVMAKEPQSRPLELSLGRISDRTESPENELDIQAVQLVQGTILAYKASRGASGMLSSQQESPDSPTIDNLSYKSPMHFQANAVALEYPSSRTPNQLIDLGSTNYIYYNKDEFTKYEPYYTGITIVDGTTV